MRKTGKEKSHASMIREKINSLDEDQKLVILVVIMMMLFIGIFSYALYAASLPPPPKPAGYEVVRFP